MSPGEHAARKQVWEAVVTRIAFHEMMDVIPATTKEEVRLYKKLVSIMSWCREQATKEAP